MLRDNVRFRRRIEATYRVAIGQARSEIIIANAYFIPGVRLQRALLRAARRGVRVTLLLQGRYEYFMQHHASRAIYGVLLDAGIEIIEYAPSFLHAKVAVMDSPRGMLSTVGSSNLDPLSLLLAREANIFVRDDAFAAGLRAQLLQAIADECQRVEPEAHLRRAMADAWPGLARVRADPGRACYADAARRYCSAPVESARGYPELRQRRRARSGRAAAAGALLPRRATSTSTPGGRWTVPSSPMRTPTMRAAAMATTSPRRRPKASCARGSATSTCRRCLRRARSTTTACA